MAEPTLEVVLPARGDTPWIGHCLRSLARQTRPADRVTLVDDGIADRAGVDRLGRELLGTRFGVVANRGRGISDALNTAVAASDADWIARMDTDDVADASRLARQLAFLETAPSGTLGCGTQVRLMDRAGRPLGSPRYPTEPAAIRRGLLQRTCFAHPTLVLRRTALAQTPYRPALDGAEDVDLVLRLSEVGELANLDAVLLDYRIDTAQHNFRRRARQTALQELAFRLARVRAERGEDPLDQAPDLAERFVAWRLGMPGYTEAREALTSLRYLAAFVRGGRPAAAASCLRPLATARPWRAEVRRWIGRVRREGPGGLAGDESPFSELARPVASTSGGGRDA